MVLRKSGEARNDGASITSRQVGICAATLLAIALSGCSGSSASQETATPQSPAIESHESRYLQICTQDFAVGGDRRAQRIACECAFEAAHKRLDDMQMEMLIAKRSRDKQRQTEIRTRQDYSEAAFHSAMKGATEEALSCARAKSGAQ